eukprot:2546544-Pyramimonas_sp.AAC.1
MESVLPGKLISEYGFQPTNFAFSLCRTKLLHRRHVVIQGLPPAAPRHAAAHTERLGQPQQAGGSMAGDCARCVSRFLTVPRDP